MQRRYLVLVSVQNKAAVLRHDFISRNEVLETERKRKTQKSLAEHALRGGPLYHRRSGIQIVSRHAIKAVAEHLDYMSIGSLQNVSGIYKFNILPSFVGRNNIMASYIQ